MKPMPFAYFRGAIVPIEEALYLFLPNQDIHIELADFDYAVQSPYSLAEIRQRQIQNPAGWIFHDLKNTFALVFLYMPFMRNSKKRFAQELLKDCISV